MIKGVVTLDGTPPKMAKIAVGDETCQAHRESGGQAPIEREEVVSKDGKLANVLVYVTSGHTKYDFSNVKLPNVQIDQHCCQYSPHVLAVMVDQAMDIKSSDPIAHNIHIMYPGDEKNLAQSAPGISPVHPKFSEARNGVIVKCDVHAWMKAYLNVLDNPFFAVTKEDGQVRAEAAARAKCEISDVAGRIRRRRRQQETAHRPRPAVGRSHRGQAGPNWN